MPTPTRPLPHRRRRLLGSALALLGFAAAILLPATAAHAQALASFRMGHFSPDTPPVDIYVTGFDGAEKLVLPALGYGQVSKYVTAAPGLYTLSLRPAGADTATPAKVITSTQLADGAAYTFAALGAQAELRSVILNDDLSAPPAGQAKVRVIQAASTPGPVDITVEGGPALATGATLGTTTDYAAVPAGSWLLAVDGEGVQVSQRLDVEAGTVNSVVLVQGTNGSGPQLTRVVDATAGVMGATESQEQAAAADPAAVPTGGVNTGGGGLATGPTGTGDPGLAAGGLLALAGVASLVACIAGARRAAVPAEAR